MKFAAYLQNLFAQREGQAIFTVADLCDMLGLGHRSVNQWIEARPRLFPAGVGLEGPKARREWTRDQAQRVASVLLSLSPLARRNMVQNTSLVAA